MTFLTLASFILSVLIIFISGFFGCLTGWVVILITPPLARQFTETRRKQITKQSIILTIITIILISTILELSIHIFGRVPLFNEISALSNNRLINSIIVATGLTGTFIADNTIEKRHQN